MGLNIELSEAPVLGRAYVPGQKISGRVIYDAEKNNEKLDSIKIIFRGKLFSQVTVSNGNNRRRVKEAIILFNYPVQLFSGREVVAKQTHMEWPFEFTIPVGSMNNRNSDGSTLFTPGGFCPLPPTFRHETNSFSYSGRCYVRYKFKVAVNGGKFFNKKKTVRDINITNVSQQPLPVPAMQQKLLASERWQSRSLRVEKHSFKQKMQHIFSDNPELKTPAIAFDCFLHFPKALAYGQTAPLSISLVKKSMGPTDPEEPTLALASLFLHFQGLTVLRVERTFWPGSYMDDGKSGCGSLRFQPTEQPRLPLNGQPILIDEQMALPGPQSYSSSPIPNFQTYTINHAHEIKAEAVIRHLESGHDFKLSQKMPFAVLPPSVPSVGQDDAQVTAEVALFGNQAAYPPNEELPAYEAVNEMPTDRGATEPENENDTADLRGDGKNRTA